VSFARAGPAAKASKASDDNRKARWMNSQLRFMGKLLEIFWGGFV
jgi:hypothetical protein